MKKAVAATILLFSSLSYAYTYENQAVCALDSMASESVQAELEEVAVLNIKRISTLSAFHLHLINQHLLKEGYTDKSLSFKEIKILFTEGDNRNNDLYVITHKATTGKTYLEIRSFPGDNPYALIFDNTGKLVATNADDSIALMTESGEVYCYDLMK